MKWNLTISGPPAQKKNSPQIGYLGKRCKACGRGQPRIFPDPKYRKWVKRAVPELKAQWVDGVGAQREPVGDKVVGLIVNAVFFLGKRQHFDLSNLIEALGDALEASGVVSSDYYIDSWGTSHRARDWDNPRIEIELVLSSARR